MLMFNALLPVCRLRLMLPAAHMLRATRRLMFTFSARCLNETSGVLMHAPDDAPV